MSDDVELRDEQTSATPQERAVADAARLRDAALDPEFRRRRGVVHTPAPLARFVLERVDLALRTLGREGIGDPNVVLIDPACGPGAFLAAAMAVAPQGAPRHVLGIDVDAAAIQAAVGSLAGPARMRGWSLELREADALQTLWPLRALQRSGATVVIVGNPPWASKSANRDAATANLLDDFRHDHEGKRLNEKKIGVLTDDYVRFWRWACELARQASGGAVVSLVTNASYLDGPVHRGMRAAMLRWFDALEILDFGGSALIARAGVADENLFGVRPAAALCTALRGVESSGSAASVRFAGIKGTRTSKLARLSGVADPSVEFEGLSPVGPYFRFCPSAAYDAEYAAWPGLHELMPFHREGVQTNRDRFCVEGDRTRLVSRLMAFARGESGDWDPKVERALKHYDPAQARASVASALAEDPTLQSWVRPYAYRPFDRRWVALIPKLCHRPRPALGKAVARSSAVLLTVRKDRGEQSWAHVAACDGMVDSSFLSARSSCRTRAFPTHQPNGSENLDATQITAFFRHLDLRATAESLLYYTLTLLSAPAYRARFDQHLREDYPRVLPPPNIATWEKAVAVGRRWYVQFMSAQLCSTRAADAFRIGHYRVDDVPGSDAAETTSVLAALHQLSRESEAIFAPLVSRERIEVRCDVSSS